MKTRVLITKIKLFGIKVVVGAWYLAVFCFVALDLLCNEVFDHIGKGSFIFGCNTFYLIVCYRIEAHCELAFNYRHFITSLWYYDTMLIENCMVSHIYLVDTAKDL